MQMIIIELIYYALYTAKVVRFLRMKDRKGYKKCM